MAHLDFRIPNDLSMTLRALVCFMLKYSLGFWGASGPWP